jgi:hypothetical protein
LVCAAVGIVLVADASVLRGDPGKDAAKALFARLENEGQIGGPRVGYELWVREVAGRRLIQPIFIRLNARSGNEVIVTAREAEVKIDVRKSQLVVRMRQGVASARDGTRACFDDRTFTVPLPGLKERK